MIYLMQVWTCYEKGNDKLIATSGDIIYKANPKSEQETDQLAMELKSGVTTNANLWWINISHCSEIRQQNGKKHIDILWGKGGEEELRVTDEFIRQQIFDQIKSNSSNAETVIEKYSIWKAGNKPFIAFFVILILFFWTFFYVMEARNGTEYYIKNGHYNSVTGIVLAIASMGLTKVLILFSILLSIALFAFINKARNPPVMNRIVIRK